MPLVADQPQIVHHAQFSTRQEELLQVRGGIYDAGSVEISELAVGNTVYPLRSKLNGSYYRSEKQLHVSPLSPTFIGEGDSAREAISDLNRKVHVAFQELIYKRPFEMNTEDRKAWKLIGDVIDVTLYRNRTPILVRQFGVILYQQRSYPTGIRWDNDFREDIDLEQVAVNDFVTYKHGQPIEAVTERHPLTRELISIPFIRRVSSLRSVREIENDGLIERIGSSSDLPTATWD